MQAGVTSASIFVGAFNVLYMKLTGITNKQTPSTGMHSPARRLLMKGMAGLGATLASSSLCTAMAAQTQSHQPGTPGNQVSPVQAGWGPFTPSSGEGRYFQAVYS